MLVSNRPARNRSAARLPSPKPKIECPRHFATTTSSAVASRRLPREAGESMPNTEAVITLSIKEAAQDDQRVFLFHLQLNGEVIAPTASLSSEDSQAARDLSKRYNALYEMRRTPNLVADYLRDLGGQLFNTWLASAWPAIAARVQPGTPRV